jgi:hypothetical protein
MKTILECLLNPAQAFGFSSPRPEVELRERTLTQRIAALEYQNKTSGRFIADLQKTDNAFYERIQRNAVHIEQVQTNNNTLTREIEELQVYTHKLSQYLQFVAAMLALALGLLLNLYLR